MRLHLVLFAYLAPLAMAQTRFEVASVRISPMGGKTFWSEPGGATFIASSVPLRILLPMAYELEEKQLDGLERCGNGQYDIVAKPEGGGLLTAERLGPRLRALLAERFGLEVHRESRVVSGYALVAAKGGTRLQRSDSGRAARSAVLRGRIVGLGAEIAVLASMLGQVLRVPVVDSTGLVGRFDYELRFAPEDAVGGELPSVFTAVQEQLGLRLESTKAAMEVLVIDACRRVPVEN